ncbi:hypothetical protein GGC47_005314 [Bosea sp. OAE752]
MRAFHFSIAPLSSGEQTVYQYNLMLLRLQEATTWRMGHDERNKFDQLGICLRAYEATLWRGGMEGYPLKCA